MAVGVSGTIWGSFTGTSTANVRPYIVYSETYDIATNTSDVTAVLWFVKYNSSWGSYNASFSNTSNINGSTHTTNSAFDIRPVGTAPVYDEVRSRTLTGIAHNADGSKSITIGWSGDTGTSLGTFNFSSTIALTTIPRAASITSSSDLTIGNNLSYTLSNAGSLYVKLNLYVWNGSSYTTVISSNRGTGSSGTITLGTTENNLMYGAMPNNTSRAGILRAYTYSDSGYTTQVGDYYDKAGTIYVNQTTNKPTFTTYTVGNLDKSIANIDKYSNTLITSSTSTLLGADTKMIKGYSKLRAVITTANKMVALNYATAVKYRFTSGALYNEQNYSADSTVNLDIDNAITNSVSVTAYDSRSLTTTVNDTSSITNNANYVATSLWGLTLTRDNGVDSETKLAFSGSYWKEYFGGGTSGVLNTITAHYRYKETTASWGAQTWTAITLTDTSGALSYDAYINGDLGASGFNTEKSYNIEVRIYDKLTNYIIEGTLNVGTPVMDITSSGISLMKKYDAGVGGSLQVDGRKLLDWFYPVGTIYETTSTNLDTIAKMSTYFGGTWEIYGAGQVLVAKSADTEFDTIGETGGAKTVTLTSAQSGVPAHAHPFTTVKSAVMPTTTTDLPSGYNTNNTGTGTANTSNNTAANATSAHTNLQPYIVVYRYRRTA